MTYAKIIADSISYGGHRLTTFEVRMHRFVLPEFNTHRVLSKNSASSRAIPVHKQINRVMNEPTAPVSWPEEQKGMQGGSELVGNGLERAQALWAQARENAVVSVAGMVGAGLHKSVTNRLLEPFMWHTVVVTGTAWENFFAQRCSPLAQPEIREVAEKMQAAYEESDPTVLMDDEWHLPYVDDDDFNTLLYGGYPHTYEGAKKISAARCARVSYLTQDGIRDIDADLALYDRLVGAQPPHWSPLEHVATPDIHNVQHGEYTFYSERLERHVGFQKTHLPVVGNLLGWRSLRVEVEAEQGIKTYV
jgi:thymidylate synthase ThyX